MAHVQWWWENVFLVQDNNLSLHFRCCWLHHQELNQCEIEKKMQLLDKVQSVSTVLACTFAYQDVSGWRPTSGGPSVRLSGGRIVRTQLTSEGCEMSTCHHHLTLALFTMLQLCLLACQGKASARQEVFCDARHRPCTHEHVSLLWKTNIQWNNLSVKQLTTILQFFCCHVFFFIDDQ